MKNHIIKKPELGRYLLSADVNQGDIVFIENTDKRYLAIYVEKNKKVLLASRNGVLTNGISQIEIIAYEKSNMPPSKIYLKIGDPAYEFQDLNLKNVCL
ncbi:MAG: hypothetical protein QXI33_00380 [Candidatus Pacearchaeota archaeon]